MDNVDNDVKTEVPIKGDAEELVVPSANDGGTITMDESSPVPHDPSEEIAAQPLNKERNAPQTFAPVDNPTVAPPAPPKPKEQPVQPNPKAPPEVTRKASWIHDIAETLAGGPQYKYSIDPNTGTMTKTAVPVSGKHLALAIALEAISGAATGLAEGRGAGNKGRGAAAAFAQGENRVVQQDQLAQKQATDEYARRAAIAQTNMHMAINQRALSAADEKMHQDYVDGYKQLYELANQAGAVSQVVHGSDKLKELLGQTLDVTNDNAIPIRKFRLTEGPDGKPVTGKNGEQLWDYDFAVVKPSAQLTMPPDVLKFLQEHKIPGYVDNKGAPVDLPKDLETRLHLILNGVEQAHSMQIGKAVLEGLARRQVNPVNKDAGTTTPSVEPSKLPEIKDTKVASMVDSAAEKYGIPPAIARALILTESGGNNKAVSPKGAVGLGQLMPATAKQYDVDPTNPEQNVDGALHYLSDLVKKNGGDVQKALAQYHGIGSDGNTTDSQYVQKVMKLAGTESAKPAAAMPDFSNADMDKEIEQLTKAQRDLLGQWSLFYDGAEGKPSSIDKMTEPGPNGQPPRINPTDAGVVKTLLNKYYPIEQYQADIAQIGEDRKLALDKGKKEQDQALKDQQQAKVESYLNPPKGFIPDPEKMLNMDDAQFRQWFVDNNIKMPPWAEFDRGVARGEIDPARASVRQYSGVGRMDAAEHEAWIKTFLDPTYNDARYKERTQFIESLNPGKQPGTVLYNAGTAVAHAQLATELFQNLNNKQSPIWNKAANAFGTQILGMAAPDVYSLVTHALANEVAKVTQGPGVTAEAERGDWQKRFGDYKSPEQAAQNLQAAMGLMAPRIGQLVQDAQKHNAIEYVQKHIQPQTLEAFSRQGIAIPGLSTRPLDTVKGAKSGRIVGFQDPETHEWVLGGPNNAGGWKL